ncbi:hypothetical protein KXR87_12265 [Yokenella regensburgei]|uniref:hypothetical protein n=1 Tax=Yokenella regensburgei TaxID=158877 RepID=UPI003F13E440
MQTLKTGIGIFLATALASANAFASSDMDSCPWGAEGCYLSSPPVLTIDNDTRDNLLRLVGEKRALTPLRQPLPDDVTRSRHYYFGDHTEEWYNAPASTQSAPAEDTTLGDQLRQLALPPELIKETTLNGNEAEGRFVSNNRDSVSHFYAALLAEPSLTPEQRTALARARLQIPGEVTELTALPTLNASEDSAAAHFRDYLLAANDFYSGEYAEANAAFTRLKAVQQPWLAETAAYMLMRTALNQSTVNANGEYGDFDVKKIDKTAAGEARSFASAYLEHWPDGDYAASTRGLLRRINWYLEEWDTLAALYETALLQAEDGDALVALVAENDSKMQSKDLTQYDSYFASAPDAPLITFTQALRLMRATTCSDRAPCVDDAYLQHIKPIFEKHNSLGLWRYLTLKRDYQQEKYAGIVAAIKPAETLPENNILLFSEQVLYGEALMAQKQWPQARAHWLHLLKLSKDVEQQQYLQAKVAATEALSGNVDAIFAADSEVKNLRYRALVLKTLATPERLREQVVNGPNNEERTIALHTLLIKGLLHGEYKRWLDDKKLNSHITQPVIDKAFADVDLTVFGWNGEQAERDYHCASLEKTVGVLAQNPQDPHALNCLGEFFRATQARVDDMSDSHGNDMLDSAVDKARESGEPDRQGFYMQIIANSKAEPEDKSFALYRAVMCYAPSGYNDCGGKEVDKAQRKAWFTQLKQRYPGSPWAQQLKYYW